MRLTAKTIAIFLFLFAAAGTVCAHEVLFKELVVDNCKEWGECRWKVKYALGYDSGYPKNLVTGYASDGEQILIHEGKQFDSFPTKMFLYVYEYDGGVGAEWEWVGSGEYDLKKPGSYSTRFNNAEGDVTLTFDVVATGSSPGWNADTVDAVLKQHSRHIGIFEKGSGGHQFVSGGDQSGGEWSYFLSQRNTLKAQGLRLVDFEIYRTPKGRRYTGIYRASSDASTLVTSDDGKGFTWSAFVGRWQDLAATGYRLVDLEVYSSQAQDLFSGVFHEGSVAYGWNINEWDAFVEGHQNLTANGLQLIDIETYRHGTTQIFAGVYAAGNATNELWIADWSTFVSLWEERAEARLPLIDVETYVSGSKRYYIGVFKTGGPATHAIVAGQNWSQFVSKWQSYSAEGYRLMDVERYIGHAGPASDRRWVHREFSGRVLKPVYRAKPVIAVGPEVFYPVATPPGGSLPADPGDDAPVFLRGEVNGDGSVDLSDVLALLNWSFANSDRTTRSVELDCEDAADANDDGAIDVSDALTQLNALYLGGAPLPAPGKDECGVDPTSDELGCKTSSCADDGGGRTAGQFPVRVIDPEIFKHVEIEIPTPAPGLLRPVTPVRNPAVRGIVPRG